MTKDSRNEDRDRYIAAAVRACARRNHSTHCNEFKVQYLSFKEKSLKDAGANTETVPRRRLYTVPSAGFVVDEGGAADACGAKGASSASGINGASGVSDSSGGSGVRVASGTNGTSIASGINGASSASGTNGIVDIIGANRGSSATGKIVSNEARIKQESSNIGSGFHGRIYTADSKRNENVSLSNVSIECEGTDTERNCCGHAIMEVETRLEGNDSSLSKGGISPNQDAQGVNGTIDTVGEGDVAADVTNGDRRHVEKDGIDASTNIDSGASKGSNEKGEISKSGHDGQNSLKTKATTFTLGEEEDST